MKYSHFFERNYTNVQPVHENTSDRTNHQGIANQNHCEREIHCSENGFYQKDKG